MQEIYHMGKISVAKQVVSICRNLNILEKKVTVNLLVADAYRFTRKYSLFGVIINIIFILGSLISVPPLLFFFSKKLPFEFVIEEVKTRQKITAEVVAVANVEAAVHRCSSK